MKIKAHAKINLTLSVLGRRPDGYHYVQMIMQSLELHDNIYIEESGGGITVGCDHQEVPRGPANLVHRAAEHLRGLTGCTKGASIFIDKNIPLAAGLAGGSADAAATLVGLNDIWGLHLSQAQLMKAGADIGADIPFCVVGGTALVEGIGERVTPLNPLSGYGVVLIKPPFSVFTAEIYGLYDKLEGFLWGDAEKALNAALGRDFDVLAGSLFNDLERVTLHMHPLLSEIKEALLAAGARGVLMSGSGPTVYGLCPDREEAVRVAGRLNIKDCSIIQTVTI